jgi:putative heme-binding domain-containing protein
MTRRLSLVLAGLAGALTPCAGQPRRPAAPVAAQPQWVWYDEGDPAAGAPAETRYFRRAFALPRAPDRASLEITADNRFVVWINGARVGEGDHWEVLYRFDAKKHLRAGKNVLAVEAKNDGGPAGLVVRLGHTAAGGPRQFVVSDADWKSARSATAGWQKVDFDDGKWGKVRVVGPYGKAGPWSIGPVTGGPRTFQAPPGFRVEPAVRDPGDRGPFSLVNMTFDARGRLLVSQENGPTLLCTGPDKSGVLQEVRNYCTQVRNSQGMCWVGDALYLVGDGPGGTGLYRCRDTKKADAIDEVTLVHRFQHGMGEHGPHAVLHGPDGCLYVVIGNHAFASAGPGKAPNPEKLAPNSPLLRWPTGGMGPDQGRPGSTEDVLLPRLNDALGHAANLRAPGGTIWRLDKGGKGLALVAAGFRNQFDAAFSPSGELFSFDSDMEWDEGLPWYRAVRAVHCPPGADFLWRTGAANTPGYYLDSLPPLVETGRGSPVGVTFYDHVAYPEKYRGAFFMADWSLGIIYAAHLKRKGATYEADVEKFCTGSPLNVTDLEVGPDGAVYFTMGGRGSQGGVFRIVYEKAAKAASGDPTVQPLAAWSPARTGRPLPAGLCRLSDDEKAPVKDRVRAWTVRGMTGSAGDGDLLKLARHREPELRAQAVWLLGVRGRAGAGKALVKALADEDALVRRRACEALVRAGVEPPVGALWPLLAEPARFVRTAARLALQRIDPKKWSERIAKEKHDRPAWEAIVALCKTGQAAAHAGTVFARLGRPAPAGRGELLDYLRTVELACFHVATPPAGVSKIAAACDRLFPHADALVNRELAILLTHFRRAKLLDTPAHAKLLAALEASEGDRPQQIHYFYCLRLLPGGWTKQEKDRLVRWYESTRDWRGGASFTPFLENIFRECLTAYGPADRRAILAGGERFPQASLVLAQRLANDRQPELLPALKALASRIGGGHRAAERRRAVEEAILRTACEHPRKEYFDNLVRGLSSPSKLLVLDAVVALAKVDARPKPDDPAPYRAVLTAAGRLDPGNRWKAVELLRHWGKGRDFGAEPGEWRPELRAWGRWFAQTFPKEPALPDFEGEKPTPSKYRFEELLAYLSTGEGKAGDAANGRKVFEKAQCAKCHRFGKEGEGLGPDLTTVSKRFKRSDTLESIYYPSKVISDQYRSTMILTTKGQRVEGLMAVQGEVVTVLQSDGSKVTLRKKDVEKQVASLVSVMPERLLDALSKREIADLFAYLESEPAK